MVDFTIIVVDKDAAHAWRVILSVAGRALCPRFGHLDFNMLRSGNARGDDAAPAVRATKPSGTGIDVRAARKLCSDGRRCRQNATTHSPIDEWIPCGPLHRRWIRPLILPRRGWWRLPANFG